MSIVSYSEASYFDGFAFSHIAAYEEAKRLESRRKRCVQHFERERRNGSRGRR